MQEGPQHEAIQQIKDWFANSPNREFRLAGYAGSGKSHVACLLPKALGLSGDEIQYLAPTNKAAEVVVRRLRELKIKSSVSTIHSFALMPKDRHCRSCPTTQGNTTRLTMCHVNRRNPECGCVLYFVAKQVYKVPKLIICDEASMVSDALYDDLLNVATNVKILFVGDPGQLPPVDGSGDFQLMRKHDFRLSDNFRNEIGSQIPAVAHDARATGRVEFGKYGTDVIKVAWGDPILDELIDDSYQAITWHRGPKTLDPKAWDVARVNRLFRESFGRTEKPEVGDRVVAGRVNRKHQIPKGTLGYITDIDTSDPQVYTVAIEIPGRATSYRGHILAQQFYSPIDLPKSTYDTWDFGYCLTCHAAQGSEFDNVLIFEPSNYWKQHRSIDYKAWLYTAITRAKSRLVIVE